MQGLSLVVASGGHSSSRCAGLSLSQPLLLRRTGSRRTGSVVVAHGPSCPTACGIFPDQGSNSCPLHWQADSQPLRHQGSPAGGFLTTAPPGKSLTSSLNNENHITSPLGLESSNDFSLQVLEIEHNLKFLATAYSTLKIWPLTTSLTKLPTTTPLTYYSLENTGLLSPLQEV